ncbi:MAG: serine--tRNA ligase, partial [Puniceicoccaceae bacterium]|nr:serine--tRNA ligase [Puniceicoccaceae bacterium]
MIDIKLLREDPNGVRAAIARKKFTVDLDSILELDEKRRAKITDAEQARAAQKAANQAMVHLEKGTPEFLEKVSEMKSMSARAKALETEAKEADQAFQVAFLEIPNLPDESVPSGQSEADNQVIHTWGAVDAFPH